MSALPETFADDWLAIDVVFTEIERFANADRGRDLVLFEQPGSGPDKLGRRTGSAPLLSITRRTP